MSAVKSGSEHKCKELYLMCFIVEMSFSMDPLEIALFDPIAMERDFKVYYNFCIEFYSEITPSSVTFSQPYMSS